MPPDQAARQLPVLLRAVVTYYHHDWEMLFVEDEGGAIFVYVDHRQPAFPIHLGDLVEVRGHTVPGDFLPSVASPLVRRLGAGALPQPRSPSLGDLASGADDGMWTELRGLVRSAAVVDDLLDLELMIDGTRLKVHIKEFDRDPPLAAWVDSRIRVRGVCATLTNAKRQFLGAELWVPDQRLAAVEEAAPPDPFATVARSVGSLRRQAFVGDHQRRLKVAGTVLLHEPGHGAYVQDDTDGIFVESSQDLELEPGDHVQALGFLARGGTRPRLEDGLLRRTGRGRPPRALSLTAHEACDADHDAQLVRVRGRLVGPNLTSREAALVLQEGDLVFGARLPESTEPAKLRQLEAGSLLEVTGVASLLEHGTGSASTGLNVLLRTLDDVRVLERPSWWNPTRVRWLLGSVSAVFLGALVWLAVLRRRVAQQTRIIRERLEREATLERRYTDLVENANDVVFSLDAAGCLTAINAAGERILGYQRRQILGTRLSQLAAEGEAATLEQALRTETRDGAWRFEFEALTAERNAVVLEVSAHARHRDGRLVAVDGIARDVTERRRAQEELRRKEQALAESQQRFALAVQGTNDGVWDWDLLTDRLYLSPRWKAMLGYAEDEVGEAPEDWFRLVHPEDLPRLTAKLSSHRDGRAPHFEDEHRVLHKQGSYRWVLTRGFALVDEHGLAYRMTGAQTDVTDRRAYDPLTGLPNRALFVERLERALARARQAPDFHFAVLFLDLDRFKVVNDSLGHLAGDELLVTFAQRLEGCVRPSDMIARFGGDEFALLLDAIGSANDVAHVSERIQQAIAAPFRLGSHEVYSSASGGIAFSAPEYERAEDVLRDADTAMYRAKAGGRARFEIFDAAMRQQVTLFMRTENDLRRALERDELRVCFQPIVELASRRIVAFEALLRWQHPERGTVAPESFVGVAEETGLIAAIGDWVLREACREAKTWKAALGAAVAPAVSVNLSARQVSDAGLTRRVEAALDASGLAAERLVLEITESAIMERTDTALARLGQLRDLGLRLHLDDFGTGYSSLSYLHRFPIEAIKIDRSFVATLLHGDGALAIIRSILSLTASLRLTAIAEGVEERRQMQRLGDLGCEQAQGFYFSRPVTPEQAAAMAAGTLALGLPQAVVGPGATGLRAH